MITMVKMWEDGMQMQIMKQIKITNRGITE